MFKTIKELLVEKKVLWDLENKPRPKAIADITYSRDDELVESKLELNTFVNTLFDINADRLY